MGVSRKTQEFVILCLHKFFAPKSPTISTPVDGVAIVAVPLVERGIKEGKTFPYPGFRRSCVKGMYTVACGGMFGLESVFVICSCDA